jgi:hypothetical protein
MSTVTIFYTGDFQQLSVETASFGFVARCPGCSSGMF